MKKHILWGAALLCLMATSCSNDDVVNNGTEVVTDKTITLNATISNGTDTRLTYSDDGISKVDFAWSNNETFTMYRGTSSEGSIFKNSAGAKDKFKGPYIEGAGSFYAVYGEGIENTSGTLFIDLSAAQVGTSAENGIKEFMVASADALPYTSVTTLTFKHKLTVLKMTLTLPDDVEGTVSMVTVSGLHNKASYSLSKGTYSYADEYCCAITATNGGEGFTIGRDHTITAYVAVFPEDVAANQVKLIANVGFNDYAYTITDARTLTAGEVVPVSASLALVKKNFKSEYTKEDYHVWSTDYCGSAPTKDQLMMYLGAGVYLDRSIDNTDGNQQTYTAPTPGSSCETYHAGLWLMKKAYISGFSNGSANKVQGAVYMGRPATSEIGKYFFLPALGYYSYTNNGAEHAGMIGFYWTSSKDEDYYYKKYDAYFTLIIGLDDVYVSSATNFNNYYQPMIAE